MCIAYIIIIIKGNKGFNTLTHTHNNKINCVSQIWIWDADQSWSQGPRSGHGGRFCPATNGTWGWASALVAGWRQAEEAEQDVGEGAVDWGGAYCTLRSNDLDSCQRHGHSPAVSGLALGQKRSRKHMFKDVFYLNKNWISSVWAWLQERRVDKARCILDSPSALSQWGQITFWPFAGVFASIFPSNICFCLAHITEEAEVISVEAESN